MNADEVELIMMREQSRLKGEMISRLEDEIREKREIIGRLHDELHEWQAKARMYEREFVRLKAKRSDALKLAQEIRR